jgi:septin family protein
MGNSLARDPSVDSSDLSMEKYSYDFFDKGIRVKMCFFVTMNYCHNVDRYTDADTLLNFVRQRHLEYQAQIEKNGRHIEEDERICLCLYFMNSSQGITRLAARQLLKLRDLLPIVPVVANSHRLTISESEELRKNIKIQWDALSIPSYVWNLLALVLIFMDLGI